MEATGWQNQIIEAWAALSNWEIAAVLLAVAYLLLAVRQNRLVLDRGGWSAPRSTQRCSGRFSC